MSVTSGFGGVTGGRFNSPVATEYEPVPCNVPPCEVINRNGPLYTARNQLNINTPKVSTGGYIRLLNAKSRHNQDTNTMTEYCGDLADTKRGCKTQCKVKGSNVAQLFPANLYSGVGYQTPLPHTTFRGPQNTDVQYMYEPYKTDRQIKKSVGSRNDHSAYSSRFTYPFLEEGYGIWPGRYQSLCPPGIPQGMAPERIYRQYVKHEDDYHENGSDPCSIISENRGPWTPYCEKC